MAPIPIGPRHPLYSVLLKVERAREHLDTLDREVSEFLKRELYSVVPSFDAEAHHHVLILKSKLAPPARFGVVVGDVVHNLRSALDHLACALALLDGSGVPCNEWPQTQFPLTSTREAWLGSGAQIQRLTDKAKSEIDSVQPYHAGDPDDVRKHPLWVLRELSNTDKHRNINPAPLAIEFKVRSTWGWKFRSDGSVELHIPSIDYLEFDIQKELTAEVTFPLGGPGAGTDIRRLRGIHDLLQREILPRFLKFFPDVSGPDSNPA